MDGMDPLQHTTALASKQQAVSLLLSIPAASASLKGFLQPCKWTRKLLTSGKRTLPNDRRNRHRAVSLGAQPFQTDMLHQELRESDGLASFPTFQTNGEILGNKGLFPSPRRLFEDRLRYEETHHRSLRGVTAGHAVGAVHKRRPRRMTLPLIMTSADAETAMVKSVSSPNLLNQAQ